MTRTNIEKSQKLTEQAYENIEDGISKLKQVYRLIINTSTGERLRSYIISSLETTLSKETEWKGGNMFTLEDIINDLEEFEEDDEN